MAEKKEEVKEEKPESKEIKAEDKKAAKAEETTEGEKAEAAPAEELEIDEKTDIKVEKDTLKEVPTEETVAKTVTEKKHEAALAGWKPKTSIGKKVKTGEIKDIDEVLDAGSKILEAQIVDVLIPQIETDLLLIGQSKESSAEAKEGCSSRHRRRQKKETSLSLRQQL